LLAFPYGSRFDDGLKQGAVLQINMLLEGALKERCGCCGDTQAFLGCKALEFGFDYGVNPHVEVDCSGFVNEG
jgi:hypothetical protein